MQKKLIMKYMIARLMHEMSTRKEKDFKGNDVAWCCIKTIWAIYLHIKTPRHATIVTNWAHCTFLLHDKE